MKLLITSSFALLLCYQGFSQSFINGDFENNTATTCEYNLPDSIFNTKMFNVHAYGKAFTSNGYIGECDIETIGCLVSPQNGNWCVALSSDTASTSDEIAMELNSPLIVGQLYNISFYSYGKIAGFNVLTLMEIGISDNDSTFGTLIHSEMPGVNTWKQISFDFIPLQSLNYITARISTATDGFNRVDNFIISNVTTDNNIQSQEFIVYPNPAKSFFRIFASAQLHNATITLSDINGKILLDSQPFNGGEGYVELNGIRNGLYFMELIGNDRSVYKQKISIQN